MTTTPSCPPPSVGRLPRAPAVVAAAGSGTKKVTTAQGTVKRFNGDKGHGFIAVEGGPVATVI